MYGRRACLRRDRASLPELRVSLRGSALEHIGVAHAATQPTVHGSGARQAPCVVLVGSKRAIARAVRTEGVGRRYAALAERLRRGQPRAAMLI
jgi:hypothetical protein